MAEEQKENKEEPAKVVTGISADDEYKMYRHLYEAYGHPGMEWAKQAYSWLVTGVSLTLAVLVAPASIWLSCAFLGLATALSVAYILRPIGS